MADIPYDTVLERVRERYVDEPEIIQRLREETAELPNAGMLLGPEDGALLAVMARTLNPERTLDIGVFTGFSALTVALNAPHARITALDVNDEITRRARRYWKEARVADRIDLRIAPALDSLDALLHDGHQGSFDFAFIDADKPNYPHYVDRVTSLLRPGGMMLLDNMLWSVLEEPQEDAELLDQLSRRMVADERLTTAVLPLGSGMTFAVRNR
ncbi:MAG TPA: class I SAM-dependent methyltransferase [Thermomicrobiales bacterium]|nr:class I SAM-dependent methyltransferase [Thermomicrobiales bacterium]